MHRRYATIAAILCAAITPTTFATNATWISPTSSTWLTPTNWSTNPAIPNAIDDSATLGPALAPQTVGINGNITLGNLTFDSPFAYTLSATSSNKLTLQTSTGSALITLNNAVPTGTTISAPLVLASDTVVNNNANAPFYFSGAISGSANMTLNGAHQIGILANNTWSGNVIINSPNVLAGAANALPSGTTILNPGAFLGLTVGMSKNFTLNGGVLNVENTAGASLTGTTLLTADSLITAQGNLPVNISAISGSSNLSLAFGAFTLTGNPTNTTFNGSLLLTSRATANLTGSLVNTPVTVNPDTSFTFALPVGTDPTANSVAPGAVLVNGGNIGVSAPSVDFRPALSANSTLAGILFNASNATLGTNALDLNAFTNSSAIRLGGKGSIASTVDLRPDLATHTFRFGLPGYNSTLNLTVNTILTDHDSAPANLDIAAANTTLAAANSYSGITTIANGTLILNNPNALGTASGTDADGATINANGTLRLASFLTLAKEKITVNAAGTLAGADPSTSIYATPIVMNGGSISNANVTGSISGPGNFSLSSATLSGNNTYTGTATFAGNNVAASPTALSPLGKNVVTAGSLTLSNISSPATVYLAGGALNLVGNTTVGRCLSIRWNPQPSQHLNRRALIYQTGGTLSLNPSNTSIAVPVFMNNSTLQLASSSNTTITNTISVAGTSRITSGPNANATLELAGGISGTGRLDLQPGNTSTPAPFFISGPVTFAGFLNQTGSAQFSNLTSSGLLSLTNATVNGTLNHTGNFYSTFVSINGPQATVHGISILTGNLTINTTFATDQLIFRGVGTSYLNGAGKLTVNSPALDLDSGYFAFTGQLLGASSIRVGNTSLEYSPAPAYLQTLPTGFSGTVDVISNYLTIYPTIGTGTTPINVAPTATLNLANGVFYNTINLNNATPSDGNGGLRASSSFATLNGPVNHGANGSTISGSINFNGGNSGGSHSLSSGNISLLAPTQYTGTTILAPSTALVISQNGSLQSTSPVVLNQATLTIDDGVIYNPDRLTNTPVVMNGSSIQLNGSLASDVTQNTGSISVSSGANTITQNRLTPTNSFGMYLALAGLSRSPGATLSFWGDQRILISSQQTTGFLGAAYTEHGLSTSSQDFVKYGADGVTRFTPSDYSSAPESAWTANLFPLVSSSVTLTSARNVAAMKIASSTLDLAGNSLNFVANGLILESGSIVGSAGNRLTAGGTASQAELIIHAGASGTGGTLAANISDNPGPDGLYDPVPGGPLDVDTGRVSVTFSEATTGGRSFTLTGTNSYSGTTYVNLSSVVVNATTAVPKGPIIVNGGSLSFGTLAAVTNSVTINANGSIRAASLAAPSYNLGSGTIYAPLIGGGTLIKTGLGHALAADVTNFSGPINVFGGTLGLGTFNNANITVATYFQPIAIKNGTLGFNTGAIITGPLQLAGTAEMLNLTSPTTFVLSPSSSAVAPGTTFVADGPLTVTGSVDPFTDSNDPTIHASLSSIPNNGTLVISVPSSHVDSMTTQNTTVSAGTTLTANRMDVGTITINGKLVLDPGHAISARTINYTNSGTLDITDSALIVQTQTASFVPTQLGILRSQVISGYQNGTWQGVGITSSIAAANPNRIGIAIFLPSNLFFTTFDGLQVDQNSVVASSALLGDATLDGTVDLSDLSIVLNNFGSTTPNWTDGNFDFAPTIDLTDLSDVLTRRPHHRHKPRP